MLHWRFFGKALQWCLSNAIRVGNGLKQSLQFNTAFRVLAGAVSSSDPVAGFISVSFAPNVPCNFRWANCTFCENSQHSSSLSKQNTHTFCGNFDLVFSTFHWQHATNFCWINFSESSIDVMISDESFNSAHKRQKFSIFTLCRLFFDRLDANLYLFSILFLLCWHFKWQLILWQQHVTNYNAAMHFTRTVQ